MTKGQAAIRDLFRARSDRAGNLPLLPAIFPDQLAPIVRVGADGERELVMARWGMPGPPQFGGAPITNIRNVKSPHWRRWLGKGSRCVVPATSFGRFFPDLRMPLLFDVSHNTCKEEWHTVAGRRRQLYVHRKGATRALPPDHPDLPNAFVATGQPVFVGGSMGTGSAILAGVPGAPTAFASACHGAGRRMSRHQALKLWRGREVVEALARRGVFVRSRSMRGVAEEAPDTYKPIDAVVDAAVVAGLARRVARLEPIICIKG